MATKEIHSQAEYDANIDFDGLLIIKSSKRIFIKGNSSVEAWENSSVVARENSSVVARGNSSVEAWENSSVVARENSSVVARENSSVVARENSSVVARGNSSVEAWDNSHVLFYEDQKVKVYGNASAKKRVEPSYTQADLLSASAKENTLLVLYKCVNLETLCDFYSGKIKYTLNEYVEAPDFDPDPSRQCGGGLHLCLTAMGTRRFNKGIILKCLVDPTDVVVYGPSLEKVRCRKVLPVAVVNLRGEVIEEAPHA